MAKPAKPKEIPQPTPEVIIVYPRERIEVRYTQAELELLLQQYEKELRRIDWSRVVTFGGLFIATLVPLVTAEFKSFSWLSGEALRGFFILAAIVSGGLFLYFLLRNLYYLCLRRPLDAHQLVDNKVNQMRRELDAAYGNLKPTTFGGDTTEIDKQG